ncbi:uncharacterized protein LOC110908118 [Helianthus annuus]|uniref:uncharacterized protein LOC110908118 n=1 Tax=Helianthus annuus TaxID=4232 RepID=UPI0016533535|nr:uncharacterized protein LOC110908118 [Helianthus annuus]
MDETKWKPNINRKEDHKDISKKDDIIDDVASDPTKKRSQERNVITAKRGLETSCSNKGKGYKIDTMKVPFQKKYESKNNVEVYKRKRFRGIQKEELIINQREVVRKRKKKRVPLSHIMTLMTTSLTHLHEIKSSIQHAIMSTK